MPLYASPASRHRTIHAESTVRHVALSAFLLPRPRGSCPGSLRLSQPNHCVRVLTVEGSARREAISQGKRARCAVLEEARPWVKIQQGPAEAWRRGIALGIARQRNGQSADEQWRGRDQEWAEKRRCSAVSEGLLGRQKHWRTSAFAGLNVEWGRDACGGGYEEWMGEESGSVEWT